MKTQTFPRWTVGVGVVSLAVVCGVVSTSASGAAAAAPADMAEFNTQQSRMARRRILKDHAKKNKGEKDEPATRKEKPRRQSKSGKATRKSKPEPGEGDDDEGKGDGVVGAGLASEGEEELVAEETIVATQAPSGADGFPTEDWEIPYSDDEVPTAPPRDVEHSQPGTTTTSTLWATVDGVAETLPPAKAPSGADDFPTEDWEIPYSDDKVPTTPSRDVELSQPGTTTTSTIWGLVETLPPKPAPEDDVGGYVPTNGDWLLPYNDDDGILGEERTAGFEVTYTPTTPFPTWNPTEPPSKAPVTGMPTHSPSGSPSTPLPTWSPTENTPDPSRSPSRFPTAAPSPEPTFKFPTLGPSHQPTSVQPTMVPSSHPTPLPDCPPAYDMNRTDYVAGSRVEVEGYIFACRDDSLVDYAPYCNMYNPDSLSADEEELWNEAWVSVSGCYVTTSSPTLGPSNDPTGSPTTLPSSVPTHQPSKQPTVGPSNDPSRSPSASPSRVPTHKPSKQPTVGPSNDPTGSPIASPSHVPTHQPSEHPTLSPTAVTPGPSRSPSRAPTRPPSDRPTLSPSSHPTTTPSQSPTSKPSASPSDSPSTGMPTISPSSSPSISPTQPPSRSPTQQPSSSPIVRPTRSPVKTLRTMIPVLEPSAAPTVATESASDAPICPDAYDPLLVLSYTDGSEVEVDGFVYRCQPYPYAYYCTRLDFRPDPNNAEDTLWEDAWGVVGPCQHAASASASRSPLSSSPTTAPTRLPTGPPSASPSDAPSRSPTHSPSKLSLSPTDGPTVLVDPVRGSPVSSSPTMGPTASPMTGAPSWGPTQSPTASEESFDLVVNPATLDVPEKRFTHWSALGDVDRDYAVDYLGYDEYTWNYPGEKELETWSHADLYPKEVDGLGLLGITDAMWDCHVNHYLGYYWNDLVQGGLDQYFDVLGWEADMWDNGTSEPETENLGWDELTPIQQAAAAQVCYSKELWDNVPLHEWETPTSAPTVMGDAVTDPTMGDFPERRFVEWMALDDTEKEYASDYLGYTQSTWDNPGQSKVETWRFQNLYESEVIGAQRLGFTETTWDCHMNHNADFYWEELVELGLDGSFIALGWDVASWDEDGPEPETEDMYWDDLTLEQQAAAAQICYTQKLWDGVPIPEWQTDATTAATQPPSKHPSVSPINQSTPSPSQTPSRLPSHHPTMSPTPLPHCPPAYDPAKANYAAGELVEIQSYVFKCREEHVNYCNIAVWDNSVLIEDENAKMHWDMAWIPVSECYKTQSPSAGPSSLPTHSPSTEMPTSGPSADPTRSPSTKPTSLPPTTQPSPSPSTHPTLSPSLNPSGSPSVSPSRKSTTSPTHTPTSRSSRPSSALQRCPLEYTSSMSLDDNDTIVLKYAIVVKLLCAEMTSKSPGWLGFGINSQPLMGGHAIIGLPDVGTVQKYELNGASPRIQLMANESQTLLYTNISQDDDGTTTMKFAKLLVEEGETEILSEGKNTFLYAVGSSNSLGYHAVRSPFSLDFAANITNAPTPEPSDVIEPMTNDTASQELDATSINAVSPADNSTASISGTNGGLFNLPVNPAATNIPEKRFLEWSLLSDTDLEYAATNLGYNQAMWNNPGEAELESWSYHDLYDDEIVGLQGLGITEEAYDCYINHYAGYWWEDIEHFGYAQYLVALGWNSNNWDGDGELPSTEDLYWDELLPEQQMAAAQLCYTRELWDAVPLTEW